MLARIFRLLQFRLVILTALLVGVTAPALAHPHVWVTMKSELVYGADGQVTGVRHAWTFDDMFSTYALQGLESKEKGKYSKEELAPLAEVNISSLKEFDFFTVAKADGRKLGFVEPKQGEYWLEFKDSTLTLHFTLALDKPVKAKKLDLETYDPSFFVDFALAKEQGFALANAPAACKLAIAAPADPASQKLSESMFTDPGSNYGAQFSTKIAVTCP